MHTLNRGVDKRKIFLDDQDHLRFIHDLFEFNNEDWVNNALYNFNRKATNTINDLASRYMKRPRKLLVDVHAFCLMPNHYHLLLSPRKENGIVTFMRKLNMGYAKYFNQKYKRTGALFEGRYKSIPVQEEAHFIHLPYYIHLNPLDLIMPAWREQRIIDHKKALTFLEGYRWSSFPDYVGIKNFPSVTNRSMLLHFFGDQKQYKKDISEWLKAIDISELGRLTLE